MREEMEESWRRDEAALGEEKSEDGRLGTMEERDSTAVLVLLQRVDSEIVMRGVAAGVANSSSDIA